MKRGLDYCEVNIVANYSSAGLVNPSVLTNYCWLHYIVCVVEVR